MEFELNADERALRDAAREFLEKEAPISYAREMMSSPIKFRDDVWNQMAELGWMALPFPEKLGGLGQGFVSLSILLTEMGRVVLPGPYLSTIISGLALGGDEELIPKICNGELRVALAMDENASSIHSKSGLLNGEQRFVLEAGSSHKIVVATDEGLFVAHRCEKTEVDVIDQTRTLAHVSFNNAEAERIEGADRTKIFDRAITAISAEMLGSAERALEIAVEYAKERRQFDKPIGSFQAVKHLASSMHVDVESARNAVWYAAWAIDRDHPDASLAASTAKAIVSDCARRVTQGCIQIHGGIGFTWEHDAHLFFKRIKLSEMMFGDSTFHRERAAMLLAAKYQTT
ncbi:MAG: acyl-CoA dehydrogenase family protein [Actinomycetota bacterium]